MQRSLNVLNHELSTIVHNHLEAMSEYFPVSLQNTSPPTEILVCLQRLLEVYQFPTDELNQEILEEAYTCQMKVENFLRLMNQQTDPAFNQTEISRILERAKSLYQSVSAQSHLSVGRIWDLLEPVKPDHLEILGNGLYEARWWNPIPWMDIYLLRHTEGVIIHDEKTNTEELPEGICVQFSLVPSCAFQDENS